MTDQGPATGLDLPFTLATCSFSEFTPGMGHPVRISRGFPKYPLKYPLKDSFGPFTPGADYLYVKSDEVFYRRLREQLDGFGIQRIVDMLMPIVTKADTDRLVVMCFEILSKRNDCHRTFVGKWWEEQTGQTVPELGATRRNPRPPDTDPQLFSL